MAFRRVVYSRRLGVGLIELGSWAVGRRRRFRVSGDSMVPTLIDGDMVLLADVSGGDVAIAGQLVVVNHPSQPALIIKRVERIESDGSLYVVSDNRADGTDSRSFGAVSASGLVGTVEFCLSRPWQDLSKPTSGRGPVDGR